jgi:glycosyltransferase involved in cell wall biosynthesis
MNALSITKPVLRPALVARQSPRVVYVADVPVESGCHGSALIFRLLSQYPASHVLIIESADNPSSPQRRLEGVHYEVLGQPSGALPRRLGRSRFRGWVEAWKALRASQRVGLVEQFAGAFNPEAVLTVAQDSSWLVAAAFALKHHLPLHLIVHDDWPTLVPVAGPFRAQAKKMFRQIYRTSESRLCVSPYMEQAYLERYGVPGTVLYPARSGELPDFKAPPERVRLSGATFAVGFAGSLFTRDYVRQLKCLGTLLGEMGGRLVIYGPYDSQALAKMGIDMPAISVGGMHPSVELVGKFRSQIDVLFLPMSFAPEDALAMSLNFPSKLTDYTAAGLPLLIWGPPESSAVRWAASEPSVAEVVTEPSPAALRASLENLRKDSGLRWRLGSAALEIGRKYFSAGHAQQVFQECLTGSTDRDGEFTHAR